MPSKTPMEQIGVDLPDPEPTPEPPPQPEPEQPPAAEAGADRPEWLPEKFKTPEALAESYKSLENELRERGQREREYSERMSQLEQQLEQVQSQRQQPQQQFDQQASMLQQFADELDLARENGDTVREAQLLAWQQSQVTQAELARFQAQQQQAYGPRESAQNEALAFNADLAMQQTLGPDVWNDETKQAVAEMIREDPGLLPDDALGSIQIIAVSAPIAVGLFRRRT